MTYKWQALAAVCFGTMLVGIDVSAVNVALPTLSHEFGVSPALVAWVNLTSTVVVTGITFAAGRLGDLHGRKRLYVAGLAIYSAGMGAAALAQTFPMLLGFRALQSLGAALTFGTGTAIVADAFPENERGQAMGAISSTVGAGLGLGPVMGGLVLEFFTWREIFWLRAPLGVVALVMTMRMVRESRGPAGGSRKLDLPGSATLFVTLASLVFAVNRGQSLGWGSAPILGAFALGFTGLAGFVYAESHAQSPVLALGLFRTRAFTAPVLSLVLNFAGQAAVSFLMPFYLVRVRGYGTVHAGLIIATVPVMMMLFAPVSGRVFDRFRFRHQPTVGVAITAFGLLLLSTIDAHTTTPMVVARLAVVGLGVVTFQSPNNVAIIAGVPRTMLGTASAALSTARNIGTSTGLALASTVVAAVTGATTSDTDPEKLLDAVRIAFMAAAAISSTAIVASALRVAEPGRAVEPLAEPVPVTR